MVDSGASISIFNSEKINLNQEVYFNDRCIIKGVTHGEIRSLGKTLTELEFDNGIIVNHEFQIVPKDFPLQVDGILGRDFLIKTKATIDYSTYLLEFDTTSDERVSIPLHDRVNDSYLVPARCEVIRRLEIKTNELKVILSKEIEDGVFIANSVSDGTVYVKIINTTTTDKIY